jgi:isopenicillin N synthase-like dioxygenase
MTETLTNLPTLSLAAQDRDPDGFAQAFGDSFRTFGFAVITDHGVDRALIDKAWEQTRLLFELPEEVKRS